MTQLDRTRPVIVREAAEVIIARMKSPERGGLWNTIEDAERRAVADFITPAGRVPSPGCGDEGTGRPASPACPQRPAGAVPAAVPRSAPAAGCSSVLPWCKPRHNGHVVVAAEVAQRIRARATAGQPLGAICAAEHLDPREARAVVSAGVVAPPVTVEPGPLAAALVGIVRAARKARS